MVVTLTLRVQNDAGTSVVEKVRAVPLGGLKYQIAQSPGLVLGVAAGDAMEFMAEDRSRFQVVERGGKVCVQMFCPRVTADLVSRRTSASAAPGGRLTSVTASRH